MEGDGDLEASAPMRIQLDVHANGARNPLLTPASERSQQPRIKFADQEDEDEYEESDVDYLKSKLW